ncbi:MAG: transglycosylase SLT domain-containing protein [Myxococcaceae bacterium]|nr:transglycosylase SLT domain-containing protein [Myxococcaceae bacterium]
MSLHLATARAQSLELLKDVQMQRPEALATAQHELSACESAAASGQDCDEKRLSLLVGFLMLSWGDAGGAAKQLASQPAPPLLGAYYGWYRGEALSWSGQGAAAIQLWEQALKGANPALTRRINTRLGEVWLSLGAPAKALPFLDAAITATPTPELLYQRGICLSLLKNAAKALADLRRVILKWPTHPHAALAQAWLEQRKVPLQLSFEESLWQARARLEGGDTLGAWEQLNALKEPAQRGKGRKPYAFWRALITAQVLFAQGKENEGVEQLNMALTGPEPIAAEALALRARRALKAADNRTAQKLFTEIDQKYPRSAPADDAAYLAAWLSMQNGDYAVAATAFDAFETRHPTSRKRDEARWFKGYSQYRAGQQAEARATLISLTQQFPQSPLVPQAKYWSTRALQKSAAPGAHVSPVVLEEYKAIIKMYAATFYSLLSQERLRELEQVPPSVFASPPSTPTTAPKVDLSLAKALAATGLLRDANEEALRLGASVRGPDEAIALGHAFIALGEYGAAHALAARLLWGPVYSAHAPEALGLMYPRAFRESVEELSTQAKIDPYFTWSIMRRESAFRPEVLSAADARGLMQVIPPTARAIAQALKLEQPAPDDLYNPQLNVRFGTWYLSALWERFGHPVLVAAAYNAGPTPVLRWASARGALPLDEWVEEISIKETRAYVKQVAADLFIYRALYGAPAGRIAMTIPVPKPTGVSF